MKSGKLPSVRPGSMRAVRISPPTRGRSHRLYPYATRAWATAHADDIDHAVGQNFPTSGHLGGATLQSNYQFSVRRLDHCCSACLILLLISFCGSRYPAHCRTRVITQINVKHPFAVGLRLLPAPAEFRQRAEVARQVAALRELRRRRVNGRERRAVIAAATFNVNLSFASTCPMSRYPCSTSFSLPSTV